MQQVNAVGLVSDTEPLASGTLPQIPVSDEVLCGLINQTLGRFGVPGLCSLEDLTPTPNTQKLAHHRVVYVEDEIVQIRLMAEELMKATRGNADLILYQPPKVDERADVAAICRDIMSTQPTLVLLDFNLIKTEEFNGATLGKLLSINYPSVQIVGFSAKSENESTFRAAGITKFVLKNDDGRDVLLQRIAALID